jgi:uncharacterized repeat protein (TIGR01451 family)
MNRADEQTVITRGDSGLGNDPQIGVVLGKVISIERGRKTISAAGSSARLRHGLRRQGHRAWMAARHRASRPLLGAFFVMLLALLGASPASAQSLTVAINPAPPTPVAPMDTITYTINLSNTSGQTVNRDVTVSMPLPNYPTNVYTAYSSATATATHSAFLTTQTWSCNFANSTITCTDTANYANTDTTTLTFVITVNAGTAAGTVLAATVTAKGANFTAGATANANVTVQNPTLSVTNTAAPNPIAPGDTLTYTVDLSNSSGVDAVANVTVSMADPANTTFVSAAKTGTGTGTWTCSNTAGVATCTDAAVYPDGSATNFRFIFTVNSGTTNGTVISSTASAQAANTTSPATASANVTVQAPTLTVTNSGAPSPIAAGDTLTYTIGLSNSSGVDAIANETVTMTDPANLTFVSAAKASGTGTWTCNNTGGTVTCTDTAIYPSGSATTFSFVFTVSPTAPNGVISSTANAQASNTTSPGTASANVTVQSPDLSISNTPNPTQVATGGTITYTQVVTNTGTVEAIGASITEITPANTTFTSTMAPANWTCGTVPLANGTGTITCTANNGTVLGAGATATLMVVVAVNPGSSVAGSTISDTATASEDGTDPNLTNNSATANVTVAAADLSMLQSASPSVLAPTGIVSTGAITYTESVTNSGPSAATAVTLYQQTPPNTTFSSMTPASGWACTTPAVGGTGQVTCTIASLASGTTSTGFSMVVLVNSGASAPPAGTTIVNYADVTSTTSDPVVSNNATQTSTLVETIGDADLAVTASASPTPVFISSTLTYAVQIANLGLTGTASSSLADTLPTGVTFVSANSPNYPSIACTQSAGVVTCPLGAVATPTTPPIIITIVVTTPGAATTLTNTATVSSTSPADPVAVNNTVKTFTVVQPLVCATPGKDGAGGTLTGIVNAYYPPASTPTTVNAGATSVALGAASGASKPIAAGDLLLIIQMQGATINVTPATINTGAYGDGVPGDPGSGSTNLGNSGQFEFITATNSTPVPVTGGTLTFIGTGAGGGLLNTYTRTAASAAQGQTTFQIIRVPQYTSAMFSSTLAALSWNGSVGGVLAVDVSSQLTLGGTVSLDGQGFRGGGGRILTGGTGVGTDYLTLSTDATNGSKGEGIAGTPTYVAPLLNTILPTTTATSTAQTYVEGIPFGSYARGAPGNAGGGATDADPPANDQNSGGGGGGNGGTGGTGGFGWNSAGIVGGFGGVAFPGSTSALIMGGGAGAGTTNNGSYWLPATVTGNNNCGANCTGIYSSGTAGGGIAIVRVGSVTGTGTITANGQNALQTENDGGGGGGAGGSILFLANSGTISGLTVQANGGNGGVTWPEEAPGTPFPDNRHGPGGGGGGGIALLSGNPGAISLLGGIPGYTTLADDAYGATLGQNGFFTNVLTITQSPGTQSGSFCAGADLAVTNVPNPTVIVPAPPAASLITYTQTVTNATGPFDAVNAVFGEAIPANTIFQSIAISGSGAAGWNCNTTAGISCTNPDVPVGATGSTTFTVVVQLIPGTPSGTDIIDTATVTSGTNDPNLTNNSATAVVLVAASNTSDLSITNTATPSPVLPTGTITYTITVTNSGPAAATNVSYTEIIPSATPVYATFASMPCPANWTCTTPAVNGTGSITGTIGTLASGATGVFTLKLTVSGSAPSGTVISETANVSSSVSDPNGGNNSSTANVIVALSGQYDLSLSDSGTPNPVLLGNNISYTQTLNNLGPGAATNPVFNGSVPSTPTPPYVTFVSLGIPSGWICTSLPAVGGTGPISCCPGTGTTCTSGSTFAAGAQVNFPMVVKVATTTPGGTIISNTITANATGSEVTGATNSATANVLVVSPTQADVTIVKTASPEPVVQGTNLTYTIQVTNNGPAVATGVSVSDPIPADVTLTSASSTQGTCTQVSPVVCTIGSVSVGAAVTITIDVNVGTFGSDTTATNTATLTTTTSNPNPNPTSSVTSTLVTPTAVQISEFQAEIQPQGGVLVEWHTKEEVRNLGFHLYRDDSTGRHRVDPSLIAGSALILRGTLPKHAAKTYQWLDPSGDSQSSYWLEDVDLNGTRTMHGPAQAESGGDGVTAFNRVSRAPLLTELNRAAATSNASASASGAASATANATGTKFNSVVPRPIVWPPPAAPVSTPAISSATLNGESAVKISVSQMGWYKVTGAQIFAAGLSSGVNPRFLRLYAEGVEQPILVNTSSNNSLGANSTIEFYGTGIDTLYSGTRVYWLVASTSVGKRIGQVPAPGSMPATVEAFLATTILEQRTTYFSALLNGEQNSNFFGAVITSEPVDQVLTATHTDSSASIPVSIDVTLQGGTDQQEHSVSVAFNGVNVGQVNFANQSNTTSTFPVENSLLQEGANTVTLTALNGDNDVSVVQSIALHYPHTYAADSDSLQATAPAGASVHITGFANSQIAVFDITNPLSIEQLVAQPTLDSSSYGITIQPTGANGSQRTLFAFSADQIAAPDALTNHVPNDLAQTQTGANYVVITYPDFASTLGPLVSLKESEGQRVQVVTTDQVFDAFNYGERSPFAVQDFLQTAATRWRIPPQAVLLVGDASLDPRNFLGLGDLDFVPTYMIQTAAFKTASDDWFTDFNQTGYATIPTGRIPADTADEAALAISKIVNYESGSTAGTWQQRATVIADQNAGSDFTTAAQTAAALLPGPLGVTKILADGVDPSTVQQQIVAAINNGTLLVDYSGHGAEDQWSFEDFFDNTTVPTLTNGNRLPVFLLMDCLNGFFQDVYENSLAEDLLFAPNGGGVAVWASSGFTEEPPQATMNQALLSTLVSNSSQTLGQAILQAKQGISDQDVRRTWILFGDPGMRIPFPAIPKSNARRAR